MERQLESVHCPICSEEKTEDVIESHLLTHSKESLISILLQLKQNAPNPTPAGTQDSLNSKDVVTTLASSEDAKNSNTTYIDNGDGDDKIKTSNCEEAISKNVVVNESLNHLTTVTNTEKLVYVESSVQHEALSYSEHVMNIDCDTNIHQMNVAAKEIRVPTLNFPVSNQKLDFSNKTDVFIVSATILENKVVLEGGNNNSQEVVSAVLQAENILREKSSTDLIAESSDVPHTSRRWTMAQMYPDDVNLSTAIKYIINENDRGIYQTGMEKDLIFLDGKYVPMHSSLSELHCSDEFSPPSPDVNQRPAGPGGDNSSVDVDLMTDEEIPPKGEISEFEESNTSLNSEDTNIKSSVLNSLRRDISPVSVRLSLSFENAAGIDAVNSRRQISRESKTIDGELGSNQEPFVCFLDCRGHQAPKQFSSLFELIQHKSEQRTPKRKDNQWNLGAATSQGESMHNQRLAESQEYNSFHSSSNPEAIVQQRALQTKNYFCLYCNFTSPLKSVLATHVQEEHPSQSLKPQVFECSTCGKIFSQRAGLRKHLLVHREKSFVCNVCAKRFPSNYKLLEHARVHTGTYPYKCTQCGKAYRTPSLLSTHQKRTHELGEPKKIELMCRICHQILYSKKTLDRHLLVHKQKPQKCPHCLEKFHSPSILVRHVRVSHDPFYLSVKYKDCSICGKFYHPNSLKSHMLIHKKEKPHSCRVCHKSFRTLGNLNNHAWSHTSAERPHKCRICFKSYIFRKNLQNHMIVHKKKTMNFVCNECGVKFTNKFNLKRHVEEHTGEKKYKCPVCGKLFFRQYYLVDHLRIHSGSRPYTCSICGKSSSTKSNHVAHLKIHDSRESANLEV